MKKKEVVDKPDHYKGDYVMIIIELYQLSFHLGNTVKYILRAGRKTKSKLVDYQKALWYLNRYLEKYKTILIPGASWINDEPIYEEEWKRVCIDFELDEYMTECLKHIFRIKTFNYEISASILRTKIELIEQGKE